MFYLILIAGIFSFALISKADEGIPVKNLDELFQSAANRYSLADWKILKAIAIIESSLGQNKLVKQGLVSSDGKSYGLMQVTLYTAKSLAGRVVTPEELNNNEISVDLAAKLFSELEDQFPDDLQSQVRAYNGGPKLALGAATLPYWKKFQVAYQSIGGQLV